VYTQVPAWLTPQRWRWTAATPTARRTWLTPLRAVAGDGPDVDRFTDPEMYVSLSLAARSTRTLARPRWSMGSRSLLTRVCTTFASSTALARTLGVSTSQFPVSHHSDVGSGRPAWPMVWDLHPSRLLMKVLVTRNMRVWR